MESFTAPTYRWLQFGHTAHSRFNFSSRSWRRKLMRPRSSDLPLAIVWRQLTCTKPESPRQAHIRVRPSDPKQIQHLCDTSAADVSPVCGIMVSPPLTQPVHRREVAFLFHCVALKLRLGRRSKQEEQIRILIICGRKSLRHHLDLTRNKRSTMSVHTKDMTVER